MKKFFNIICLTAAFTLLFLYTDFSVSAKNVDENVIESGIYIGDVDVSGLGSVSISMDALMKKDVLGFGAGLSLGKKSVISLDALLDMKNQKAYLQIPELNKKYLGTENEDQDDAEEFREEYEKLKTALDGFPKKKQLDKLMEKYIELALSQIKEVKKTTEKIE
ncbi:MAG: hypothetical protein ACI4C0_06925, partial [Lachnospiraceae bacterium]